jgi:inosine/xanthosine triphosphate pyrophosphatase family protein
MDTIEDYQQKNDIEEIIRTAANKAMDKLKKYYKYTDAIVYTVSTSMYFFFTIL